MDEGTCLENRHTFIAYRGFESRPLRQVPKTYLLDPTLFDTIERMCYIACRSII